jgi:hypothetical protein
MGRIDYRSTVPNLQPSKIMTLVSMPNADTLSAQLRG